MDTINESRIVIQSISFGGCEKKVGRLDMLRLDEMHPIVSGNKWFKLKYNLIQAQISGRDTIVTFGGGYSNHLVATAGAAKAFGWKSIGIVRGIYAAATPTIKACRELDMELIFVTKEAFSHRTEEGWLQTVIPDAARCFIAPEGGANAAGIAGAATIWEHIPHHYTHIICSVGTGTTLLGLSKHLPVGTQLIGVAPFKHNSDLESDIYRQLPEEQRERVRLLFLPQFGGFGKWNKDLTVFMNHFFAMNQIPLDIIYTSKMMFGVRMLLEQGYFLQSDTLLCIHSGGLQGNIEAESELDYKYKRL
jgi:1-aminocyclopropane-1-carboxylate deaminase